MFVVMEWELERFGKIGLRGTTWVIEPIPSQSQLTM